MVFAMQDLSSLKGFEILTRIRDWGMPKIYIAIWRDCAKIWFGMTGLENPIGDSLPYSFIRELKRQRRRRECQTSNRFRFNSKTTSLHVHHAFLYISWILCRRCTTTTWNCLISRYVEDVNSKRRPSFSFPELWYSSLLIQLQKRFTNIWQIVWDEIRVIKFNVVRTYFLTDVFVTCLEPGSALGGKGEKNQGGQKKKKSTSEASRERYLDSLRSLIFFLFDPVFCLFPPLRSLLKGREGVATSDLERLKIRLWNPTAT